MIWLILIGVVGFLVWYNFFKPMNHFTKIGVKQSRPWPLFGDQWRTVFKQKSFFEFVQWGYTLYPNNRYSGIYQMTIPTLVLRDPELIKQITVNDFDHFTDHKSFIDPDVDPLWGGNLFSLRGQKWREMRDTLNGSFTSSQMKSLFNLINESAENFVQFFSSKNQDVLELEMKDAFTRYTNDVIATTAFGIKVNSLVEPNNQFYLMGKKATNLGGWASRLKFFGYLVVPSLFKWLKISLFPRDVTNFFRKIIHETIQIREEKGIVRPDMINLLMEAKKGMAPSYREVTATGFATVKAADLSKFKQVRNLSNDNITSQALTFFFAGFDTISTALCFGSYELAINKDIQDRLRAEVIETHKTNNGILSYDALLNMKYLDMVVTGKIALRRAVGWVGCNHIGGQARKIMINLHTEILRKWPPAAAVDRICTKPYTIAPLTPDERPVHIEVGDMLWLPIVGLHRDSKFFSEPEKFEPERFSYKNRGSIRPYTYLPFGFGPRTCIGARFALLQAKALLYHLLLNFEILPTKKTIIPLKLDRKTFNVTAEGGFW